MARIREGTITVPYPRSGKFGKGWKLQGHGINQTVINDVSYAKWVMGDMTQAKRQKIIGWKTRSEKLDKMHLEIAKRFREKTQEMIRKYNAGGLAGFAFQAKTKIYGFVSKITGG
jgi:hypothetical protein